MVNSTPIHANVNAIKCVKRFAILAVAMAFTFSCSSDDGDDGKVVVGSSSSQNTQSSSSGDGNGDNIANYKIKQIGTQVWMAENLNYDVPGSKCYGEDGKVYNSKTGNYDLTLSNSEIQANCAKYGRLYDWETAKTVCPAGWHLPNDAEWTALMDFVGGASTAGKKLKATSGWNSNGNGTDEFGFSALPGGHGYSGGGFYGVGNFGYWWSASEDIASAYYRYMGYDIENVGYILDVKYFLFSVRCVQD